MASPSASSTCGGTRVENILKALHECLELNPNPSESFVNNKSSENSSLHENSNTPNGRVQLNEGQSNYVTIGAAADSENILSTHAQASNLSSKENQTLVNHQTLDTSNSNGSHDGVQTDQSCETNGVTRDDINNGNINNRDDPIRSSDDISDIKRESSSDSKDAGVTSETATGASSVANETEIKSSTTSAVSTSGDADDDEEIGESLLAKKLALVMEKLEAYRATRDYMMALSNKLKEENARYEAEYGNTSEDNTEVAVAAASIRGSSSDSVNGDAQDENTQNGNETNVHILQAANDSVYLNESTQITSANSVPKPTENSNRVIDAETHKENIVLHSEESNLQDQSGSVKIHVDKELSNKKPKLNGHNQSNHVCKSENDQEAEADEENDVDEDVDYEDYYDVAEDIDYVYGLDHKVGNESAIEHNKIVTVSVTAEKQELTEKFDDCKSETLSSLPVPEDRDNASKARQSSSDENQSTDKQINQQSGNSNQQHQKERTPENWLSTTNNGSYTVSCDEANANSTEKQQSREQGQKSDAAAVSSDEANVDSAEDRQNSELDQKSDEAAVYQPTPSPTRKEKDVLDLSRVERLNLMLRLQTEFAKMALQMVEMQENMRTATAALQRLAALEGGEDEQS